MTAYISSIYEDDLGDYWLQVWRSLVEQHWDYVVAGTASELYDFAHLRKHQPDQAKVDERVADLASDYWTRNRFALKEYFINWTCEHWDTVLAVEKDVVHCGWISCGADPAYPSRRHGSCEKDALRLAKTCQLQLMLKKAELHAYLHKACEEMHMQCIKHRRRSRARWRLLRIKAKKLFKKALFFVRI